MRTSHTSTGPSPRLGGDDFLVVMADIEPGRSAEKAAERVAEAALRSFSDPFPVNGQEFFVSVSIGISVFPDDGERAERLLQHADTALYQAKEEGRHAFRFFTPDMNRRAQRRATMEGHLLHAVERKELSLVYQPIVSLRTGSTVAFEALLRWQNPALGAVSPALFIPLAEETGLIQEISEWVLDEAVADLASWDPGPALRLAVNVSSRQLRNPRRFLNTVEAALGLASWSTGSGSPPEALRNWLSSCPARAVPPRPRMPASGPLPSCVVPPSKFGVTGRKTDVRSHFRSQKAGFLRRDPVSGSACRRQITISYLHNAR